MDEASDSKNSFPQKFGAVFWAFAQFISLDLRSLALARIALAFVCLVDLWMRYGDLEAHYGPFGVLPGSSFELFFRPHYWSVHTIHSVSWVKGMFGLHALAALAMMLGFRTRLAVILVWFFTTSLHARNPMVLNGGDTLFRVVMFWMIFLPLDHHYGVQKKPSENRFFDDPKIVAFASLALTFQFAFLYTFAAFSKTGPAWLVTGKATEIALSIDSIMAPAGYWFRDTFLNYLDEASFGVLFWEAIGPVAFFLSARSSWIRAVAVFGFMFMHLSFGVMMTIGTFSPIAIAALLLLLPSCVFDRGQSRDYKLKGVSPKSSLRVLSFVVAGAILLCFRATFAWNLAKDKMNVPGLHLDKLSRKLVLALRLDQNWDMFSPHPSLNDGWYEIPGYFEDGTTHDLFWSNGKPAGEKPTGLSGGFPNNRWRKYFMTLRLKAHKKRRLYFGQYLCRLRNKKPGPNGRLIRFTIDFKLEKTTQEAIELKPRHTRIWKHRCLPEPKTKKVVSQKLKGAKTSGEKKAVEIKP